MKKSITFLLLLFFAIPCFGDCTIALNQEQYDNLDLLHKKCLETYPTFGGFHGTKGRITAVGISDCVEFFNFISSLNIDALKQNDKDRKAKKKLRKKFKDMGLDNDDLKLLNLDNDIPDA